MTDDKHIRQLFEIVADAPTDQRAKVAAHLCGGDEALQRRVLHMVAAAEGDDAFLAEPGVDPQPAFETIDAQDPPDEQPGDQIGPYKLLQQIGEGGFGVVWMAEQREPVKRRVALKVIKLGMDTKQVVARFMAERQALAMMDHPNIAKVFDAGSTDKGRPYFVMEYIRGVAITEYCDTERLDTVRRLELFRQTCHAIQHAHQKGIIHRDIKPSNVLVTMHDGVPVPKVIDFGVAKATNTELTQQTLFTEHRQMIGTPAYMSPEQAEMSGLDIDTRADVYSLGVLLYELLTGTTPFDIRALFEAGYSELMRVIREEEPQKPSTCFRQLDDTTTRYAALRRADARKLGQSLRGDLDWIVMKCLEKDRTRRYETANGLAEDIRRHLDDEPVEAGPPSSSYRLQKFLKRNRGQVIASSAVVAALLVGIVGFAWQAQEARRQRDDAAEQRRLADLARNTAQEQAEVAEAIASFQTNMLAAADPLRLLGDTVTVAQVLTGAVEELDAGALEGQPLVEANVRQTIGATFLELGRLDEAEEQCRTALALFERVLPPGHQQIGAAKTKLAIALWQHGQSEEAERIYRQQLRTLVDGTRDPMDLAIVRSNLASLLASRGDSLEAEDLARRALGTFRAELPPDDPELATALIKLGSSLADQGRAEEAEPLLREALGIRRSSLPAQHPHLALALAELASLLQNEGDLEQAEPLWREARAIEVASLPEGHESIANSSMWLGQLLWRLGRPDEAEPLLREALTIRRENRFVSDEARLLTLRELGSLLAEKNAHDEAEPLLREALSLARAATPVKHDEAAIVLGHLMTIEKLRGNPASAETLAREAVASARIAWPADDPRIANADNGLGLALWDGHKLDEALAAFEQALKLRREVLPAGDPEIGVVLHNVGGVLRDMGRLDDAEPPLREAVSIWRKAYPEGHRRVAIGLNGLALLLQRQNKLDAAERLLREALTTAGRDRPPSHPELIAGKLNLIRLLTRRGRLADAESLLREITTDPSDFGPRQQAGVAGALSGLGFTHWQQGRLDRSIPLFEQAIALYEQSRGADHFDTLNTRANLGVNYRDAGRLDEAIPLLEEAHRAVASMPRLAFASAQLFETYVRAADPAQPETIERTVAMANAKVEAARRSNPVGSPALAVQLALIAQDLLRAQAFAAAEPLAREVQSMREVTNAGEWPVFHAQSMLGQSLLGQDQPELAEPLLLSGYRGMKERETQIPKAARAWIGDALEQLIRLYTENGDSAAAESWQRELDARR